MLKIAIDIDIGIDYERRS